ncbi:hypothetical protein ACQP2X_21470 [Actinoplanes sp. CA-131856]
MSHEELFRRYVSAGAISRDPDAVAELFAEDAGSSNCSGRRRGRSGYLLGDPEVFIAEITSLRDYFRAP